MFTRASLISFETILLDFFSIRKRRRNFIDLANESWESLNFWYDSKKNTLEGFKLKFWCFIYMYKERDPSHLTFVNFWDEKLGNGNVSIKAKKIKI